MTYDKAELVALDKKYVWHHLTQHKNFEPAIYVKGEGMRITDIDGMNTPPVPVTSTRLSITEP